MNTRQKVLTASAVGLLLGFGLCGVDTLLPSSKTQEFGGILSFLGFVLCLVSVLLLIGTLLSFAVTGARNYFRGRR